MKYVARHSVDAEKIRARIDSHEPYSTEIFERLGTKNAVLEPIFQESFMLGTLHCAVDPAGVHNATVLHFKTAQESSVALFVAADGPADPLRYDITGRSFLLKRTGPRRYHKVEYWLTSLWLSIVLRNAAGIARLTSTPISALRESGTRYDIRYDEFQYSWIDSLQKFFRRDAELEASFVETMEGTAPHRTTEVSEEVLLDLLYPPIEIFYHVLRRDTDQFNESLQRALHAHKRYWSTPDRRTTSYGMIALAPLAVTVLAKQSGMNIEVKSEYLPRNLLLGEQLPA
ncbi:immunity 49 family protein [Streptomyces sp. 3N207]|uniref:immunity 49 family protein n=1 Tax=Streptomyces sp. 3N207 TaxID=3457417 RepID=UPI003FD0196B